jgi:hypothetical protein
MEKVVKSTKHLRSCHEFLIQNQVNLHFQIRKSENPIHGTIVSNFQGTFSLYMALLELNSFPFTTIIPPSLNASPLTDPLLERLSLYSLLFPFHLSLCKYL